ncbi:MAG: Ferrous iron transporter, FeoA subunit domain protein [Candidatus Syntrophoarchaeum caldarius]|uniref:Ferrous iron transporter, FeoA subunit domain protein n=1 Tax=Candidatus Syntropharchaeum caldarium TaxID=1838285 RepID=A0A1F2P997_9EURY|nr:MAG: Ferrous iron transporter, FeoA subunit domain protein [Candidatus Syntrophoarchaeum caldarius]
MTGERLLTEFNPGEVGRVKKITGGHGIQHNIRSMGIREGKILRVMTRQPLRGPIVIEVDGMRIAIGRGMAKKIILGDV